MICYHVQKSPPPVHINSVHDPRPTSAFLLQISRRSDVQDDSNSYKRDTP